MTTVSHSVILFLTSTMSTCFAVDATPGPTTLVETIAAAKELVARCSRDTPQWGDVAVESRRLSVLCDALVQVEGVRACNEHPEFADLIAKRSGQINVRPPAQPSMVLYAHATPVDIREAWVRQLRDVLCAVHGLLSADPPTVKEWMMAWVEAKPGVDGFFRLEHARDYLIEAEKLAALLASEAKTVHIGQGRVIFSDDFSRDSDHWQRFGPGNLKIGQGRLWLRGSGTSVVCDQVFPNAIIAFDFTPIATGAGTTGGSGSLFAFSAAPLSDRGFTASAGPMADYNYGIDTYHVSLFRGATGCSNLRRTGRGLRKLSHVEPDPCAQLGRTYHVELVKSGSSVQVFVDGRLIHAYVDVGAFGVVRDHGCFGIRTFAGDEMELAITNFFIFEPIIRIVE